MDLNEYIAVHDKRVLEIRELLAPVEQSIRDINLRYDTLRKDISCDIEKQYLTLFNLVEKLDAKFDSVLLHTTETRHDVSSITKELNGNGKPGVLKKIAEHDRYFNMAAGGLALISFAFAGFEIFKYLL